MHVFRLVEGGVVDKMIAFDSLPNYMVRGIKTKPFDGFQSFWKRWAKEHESTRTMSVLDPETGIKSDQEQPCTFMLDYKMVNEDKQKWQEITNYVRKAVDLSVRLMDKIEDMAIKLSKDSYSELDIEPEQVPIISLPKPVSAKVEDKDEPVAAAEPIKKKPGRPKKIAVGV